MHSMINLAQQMIHAEERHSGASPIPGRLTYLLTEAHDTVNGQLNASSGALFATLQNELFDVKLSIVPTQESDSALPSCEPSIDAFWLTLNGTKEKHFKHQAKSLEEHLRVFRPSALVISTGCLEFGIVALIASSRVEIPLIVDMRGYQPAIAFMPNWLSYMLNQATAVIVDSEQGALQAQGIAKPFITLDSISGLAALIDAYGGTAPQDFYQYASQILSSHPVPISLPAKANPKDYRVLTIMDEFTHNCFQDEFTLIPASNKNWLEQLVSQQLDFLFVESAWRGNRGDWSYSVSKIHGKFGTELLDLLLECRKRGIPTVFWNKEDPVNYDVFIDAARCFDYVFTTDESVIENYKKACGHDRVYLLKFAAHSRLHAPILRGERNGRVAFAGSWNAAKYPLRGERLDMLFKYPLAKGVLDIYDRYSGAQDSEPGLVYPEKYRDCLLPAVPYSKIANTVYKKYSVMLNVNSVENSDSMLARRIYELCGCGTPIVSSPSNAIKSELAGVVKIARNEQEAEAHISGILEDDIESLRISANGVRFIHDGNTYRHRFGEMLARLTASSSMTTGATIEKPAVTAICVSKRPWFAEQTARMLKQQNGVEVHAVYVAHGEDTNEQQVTELFKDFASFTFMRMIGDDKVLADGLNMALEQCKTDLVAKIDDDDYYGPNYLKDACLALEYSDSALVGKASFFCYVESSDDFALRFPGKHYRYLSRVHGGTLVWSRSKTQNQSFTRVKQGTDSYFIQGLKDKNLRVFSTDPFNFVHVRYSSNNAHTWAIEDEEFLQNAQKLSKGLNLDLSFN